MDNKNVSPAGKLIGADGIRAMACLFVIAHHLFQRLTMQAQTKDIQDVQAFFLMGNAGVSIFFVLSGFLLSYPFWKNYLQEDSFPDMKQYIIRRATRIIPGYYIALIVSIIATAALKVPSESLGTRLLAAFTFTSGFHYVTFFPVEPNGALWSISFEVFSYLLMPLFMFLLFKISGKSRSVLKSMIYWAAAMAAIIYINKLIHLYLTPDEVRKGWQFGSVGGAKYWMPNYNPIGFFAHFALGIIAAGIATGLFKAVDKIKSIKNIGLFDILVLLSIAGAFYMLWAYKSSPEFSHSWQKQPYFFPYFPALMAVALAFAPHTKLMGIILDNPFFRYTSKVSFGLYVWHYFLVFLVANLWAKDYVYMGVAKFGRWAAISLLILAASYIIATISYYFVEKPILEWGHRITSHKKSKDKYASKGI